MKTNQDLRGVFPIIPTPYTLNSEVDYDSLQNLLRSRKAAGVHGMTLFGIAGEYYKQTDEESRKMAKLVGQECAALDMPVVMSVTQHATVAACNQAKYLQDCGADCIMILPPFFMKPGAAMVEKHIEKIAASVDLPVMVQYAPEQTGVTIGTDMWKRLAEKRSNIKYFKIENKPSGAYISTMMREMDPKPGIFVGNCGFQMLENFERGAMGCMPCAAIAEMYIQIYDAWMAGNKEEAVRIHNDVLPLYNHIRQNVEMSIHYEKHILKLRGIIATDVCREPTFTGDKIYDDLFDQYYAAIGHYFIQR